MRRLLSSAVVLLLASTAAAADCYVVKAKTTWTPDGPREGIAVVVRGAKIESVGPETPADCEVIVGAEVTPGLVEVATAVGLAEVGMEAASVDTRAFTPEDHRLYATHFDVADGYNPRSSLIPIARLGGITSVVAWPRGGRVSGRAAWADLTGRTQATAVIARDRAMVAHIGGSDRARGQLLSELDLLLTEAAAWGKARKAWENAKTRPYLFPHATLAPMLPVLAGQLPLAVHVNRAADIEALLRLAQKHKLKLVLIGGAEAHLMASALARANVAVVIDPLIYGVRNFDSIHGSAQNVTRLAAAGVPVMLNTGDAHNIRVLRQVAGNAVRAGLDRRAAIKAITQTPADTFGMPNRGRLTKGAQANLVVWSGDPLELSSAPIAVLIGGQKIGLESRQTRLRDRYLRGTGTGLPAALPLP